jgi:hypothetical protein
MHTLSGNTALVHTNSSPPSMPRRGDTHRYFLQAER